MSDELAAKIIVYYKGIRYHEIYDTSTVSFHTTEPNSLAMWHCRKRAESRLTPFGSYYTSIRHHINVLSQLSQTFLYLNLFFAIKNQKTPLSWSRDDGFIWAPASGCTRVGVVALTSHTHFNCNYRLAIKGMKHPNNGRWILRCWRQARILVVLPTLPDN